MSELADLQKRTVAFRDARNWKQFHNPKDLAISLLVEATELLDEFKWKNEKAIELHLNKDMEKVADELMDVLYHVLLMCADLEIDILSEYERKMQKNETNYPVEMAKGRNIKYTELHKQ